MPCVSFLSKTYSTYIILHQGNSRERQPNNMSRSLVPLGLGVQTQHRVGQRRRVRGYVRGCILGRVLNPIQDAQHLFLDEVDKDQIDRGIARHVGRVGADVVRNRVVRQRDVQRVVASAGASLPEEKKKGYSSTPRKRATRKDGSYVRGDVSKRQVLCVARLYSLAFFHVFQPATITALDISAGPQ